MYYVFNCVSLPTFDGCGVEAFVICLMPNLDTSWPMDLPDVSMMAFEAYFLLPPIDYLP